GLCLSSLLIGIDIVECQTDAGPVQPGVAGAEVRSPTSIDTPLGKDVVVLKERRRVPREAVSEGLLHSVVPQLDKSALRLAPREEDVDDEGIPLEQLQGHIPNMAATASFVGAVLQVEHPVTRGSENERSAPIDSIAVYLKHCAPTTARIRQGTPV